jgi:tetratricopeptide (TPR) repeat protein
LESLFGLELYDEAIIEYDKAITIDPDYAISLYNKAYVYALENNKNKLIKKRITIRIQPLREQSY